MQQQFHVSLSTRPPHISCNLFCLCLSCSNSLSIHNKVMLFLQNGYIFLYKNRSKKDHRSKSLLWKDFLHTGGLWEIRILKKKGGGGSLGDTNILEEGCLTELTHECFQLPKHREYPHRCDCVIPNPFCKQLVND